jgi:hypothetical protein
MISFRVRLAFVALSLAIGVASVSCSAASGSVNPPEKISPELRSQVELRRQQLAAPTEEKLALMRARGMDVTNIGVQRIFIHLNEEPTPQQLDELESLGVRVFSDSWLPPVGVQSTGFVLADMPVDRLSQLAGKEYVVKLDTAERLAEPKDIPGEE